MEETNKHEEKKMSYEDLNNVATQLSAQVRSLYQRLQEANMQNAFQRLNYLFKVLEQANHFQIEFVDKCALEIIDIMTIEPPKEETEKNKDSN